MNRKIKHGSIEELLAIEARRETSVMSPEAKKNTRRSIVEGMEQCDPGATKAHELAKKYR